jgi:hypothetical protein
MLNTSRILTWAILLALPLWFSNCSKTSSDPAPAATIAGSYKITSYKVSPAVSGATDILALYAALIGTTCLTDLTMTFKADGTITQDNPKSCSSANVTLVEGKWTSSSNTQMTIIDSQGVKTSYTIALTSTSLTIIEQTKDDPFTGKPGTVTYTITLELKRV